MKQLEKDEESEIRDMVKSLNKREFESEVKKKSDRDDNKNHNIEMQVFEKNQNNIDVNLIVSSKEEEKNIDAERVPIFNALNKNIFSKKCLLLKKSTKKNATFY
jgi:N-methylhydantoinase B/oxoprolinase/acetone carboxylase alpha subunit